MQASDLGEIKSKYAPDRDTRSYMYDATKDKSVTNDFSKTSPFGKNFPRSSGFGMNQGMV